MWSAPIRWNRRDRGRPNSSAAATGSPSWAEEQAFATADAIIAVSTGARSDILETYPFVDPARIHVIHNGIDTSLYATPGADVLAKYGIDPNRPSASSSDGSPGRRVSRTSWPRRAASTRPIQLVLCAGAPDTPEIAVETPNDGRRPADGPRPAWCGSRDAAPAGGDALLSAVDGVRLPVDLRTARHRQPGGDGLRDRRGRQCRSAASRRS